MENTRLEVKKYHFGDKKDAWRVRDLDPLHNIMNYVIGTRTDNEALSEFDIDMTNLNAFIDNKNKDITDSSMKYTFFHAVLAALAITVKERKNLNYFVRNRKFWERKIISLAYVAKKKKVDGSEENIIIQEYHPESEVSPIKQMHDKTCSEVKHLREDENGNSESAETYNKLLKLPGFILGPLGALVRFLDKHGLLPYSFFKQIPYSATVFISNLGSIKFNANYHHLVNFGSNSIFVIIGSKHFAPLYNEDGSFEMHEYLPISFTLDERIADGVYFAKSLKVFQALLLRPELLDTPANEKIDFEKLLNEVYGDKK